MTCNVLESSVATKGRCKDFVKLSLFWKKSVMEVVLMVVVYFN